MLNNVIEFSLLFLSRINIPAAQNSDEQNPTGKKERQAQKNGEEIFSIHRLGEF
jgi:hypothetical protein